MPDDRPAVPRPMARDVKVEAGHRCAIPTCRGVAALEIAHIEPWSDVREHEFSNLILLCAVCHHRYDHGEIDRIAMRTYKANLALLNARYGEFERRVFEVFAVEPGLECVSLPGPVGLHLWYALRDGLLINHTAQTSGGAALLAGPEVYCLTAAGRAFVERMASGLDLS